MGRCGEDQQEETKAVRPGPWGNTMAEKLRRGLMKQMFIRRVVVHVVTLWWWRIHKPNSVNCEQTGWVPTSVPLGAPLSSLIGQYCPARTLVRDPNVIGEGQETAKAF